MWVVPLLGVVSLMAGETTGVSMSSESGGYQTAAAALLHNAVNIRNIYLLHRGSPELHHRVVCPSLLHRRSQVLLFKLLKNWGCCSLHRGLRVLHYNQKVDILFHHWVFYQFIYYIVF
jgi:hypothetical protein